MILKVKNFGWKILFPNRLLMIQNVKKGRRFCRSVGRPDRPADRIWPATVFFSFYNSKWSKTWKKTVAGFADRSVRSVRRTEFDRRPFFSPFGSFGVDLEIFFFNQKVLTKKNLSTEYLTIDHTWQKSRDPGILDPLMSIWGQPRVALYIWTYLVKFWLIWARLKVVLVGFLASFSSF